MSKVHPNEGVQRLKYPYGQVPSSKFQLRLKNQSQSDQERL
jgi:hypothetical protein